MSHSANQQSFFAPKPNINDLKQLFDDNFKRHNNMIDNNSSSNKQNMLDPSTRSYYDAKPSFIEADNPFEQQNTKSILTQRNMFDFERAKQKFDNQTASRMKNAQLFSKHQNSSSKNSHKRNSSSSDNNMLNMAPEQLQPTSAPFNKQNFNETVQFFDENNMRHGNNKKDSYGKGNNLNLDGLKVSEDDDVSNSL